jgi:transcriptional regulator GlxA family with amidase domain
VVTALVPISTLADLSPGRVRSVALAAGPSGPSETERAVQAVLSAIDEDARAYRTVTEMAAHAGIGVRQFERLVYDLANVSPARYHNTARLNQARNLLALTDLPLTTVAIRVGYSGQPGLTYLLQREIGMTPAEYRRRVKP